MTRNKIIYIAQAHSEFPSKWANNFQVMKMCSSLVQIDTNITLLVPGGRRVQNNVDIFGNKIWHFYGASKKFNIELVNISSWNFPFRKFVHAFIILYYLIDKSFDAVYTRSEWVALIVSLVLRKSTILELHDFQKTIAQQLLIFTSKKNQKLSIVAISHALKNTIVSQHIHEKKVYVLHDGVNLADYQININKEEIRKKLNVDHNKSQVIHLGKIGRGRGTEYILKAASQLKEVNFTFIGSTVEEISICNKFDVLPKNVTAIPSISNSEIPEWLKCADILIMYYTPDLTTINHMSPLKMFEYMASKVPIISSDFPVLREVLNENNSLLIKHSNSSELIRAIKFLNSDKEYGVNIANNAYCDVQKFDWKNRAIEVVKIINRK